MSRDTAVSMTTMAIALAMGLHATHMLVPPTPGPLAVTGILGADLGMVILLGMLVSIPVVLVAHAAGKFVGKSFISCRKNWQKRLRLKATENGRGLLQRLCLFFCRSF